MEDFLQYVARDVRHENATVSFTDFVTTIRAKEMALTKACQVRGIVHHPAVSIDTFMCLSYLPQSSFSFNATKSGATLCCSGLLSKSVADNCNWGDNDNSHTTSSCANVGKGAHEMNPNTSGKKYSWLTFACS
jgi:hypothetical protein